MAETGQDFHGWAGDDIDLFIAVLGYDGLPLDLTDATLIWTLGDVNAVSVAITKTSDDPTEIEFLDTVGGQVVIHLNPDDSRALAGNYRHELKIHDAFQGIETILVGWTTIHPASVHPAARRRSEQRSDLMPLRVVA